MHVFNWLTQYMTPAGREGVLIMLDLLVYMAIGMAIVLGVLTLVAWILYKYFNAQWRKEEKKKKEKK